MIDSLSYGDKICLYYQDGNGYIHTSCTSSEFNQIRIFNDQDIFQPDKIKDIQTVVFEVVIPNRYKLNKQYSKIYSQDALNSDDFDLKIQAEQAKAAVLSENKDNALEQKRNLGKSLHYGDIIQLRHVFTDKYVHVNISQTSLQDKDSMVLGLWSFNSKSAQFKIIPRYKVKFEGDIVQYMDLVAFESVKAPGHYFHASEFYQMDHLFYGSELNLSLDPTGFTIVRSSSAEILNNENVFSTPLARNGDYIQLVHKEIDAYIESFGLRIVNNIKTKVKLRLKNIRKNLEADNYRLSTSAFTFWQIEMEDNRLCTEKSKWINNYRIRHAINRMYLCVKKDYRVTLTNEPRPNTVFKFHPQTTEENIRYNTIFRIEHVLTGTWLHGKREIHDQEDPFTASMNSNISITTLKWATSEFRDMVGVKQRLYDDAFVIYQVPPSAVTSFNKLSGFSPLLSNMLIHRQKKIIIKASLSYKYQLAMEEIRDYLLVDNEPDKNRQKYFRNLELVDMVVELVLIPFYDEIDKTFTLKIYQACYEILLNYMKKSCLKNTLYFAKYIKLFLPKMLDKNNLGGHVIEMITELIRDNEKVLELIPFENIDSVIYALRETQNPRFLEFLMTFCVCAKEPCLANQREVAIKWLTEDYKGTFQTERGQNIKLKSDTIYIKTVPETNNWLELHLFLDRANTNDSDKALKEYFLKQINLLLAICYGRNEFCLNTVINKLNYVSWEECYAAICSEYLPYYMKMKYFEIIETMLIDIGKNYAVIDSPKYNFVYNQIHSETPTAVECMFSIPSEETTKAILPNLTKWIFNFLEDQTRMYSREIDLNYLTSTIFRIINKLIQYGYFDSESIKRILQSLERLLDGRRDELFEANAKKDIKNQKKIIANFRKKIRFEDSDENRALVSAKLAGLDILESVFIYERVTVVSMLISKFKQCNSPNMKVQKRRLKGHTHLIPCLSQSFDMDLEHKKSSRSFKKMILELDNMFSTSRLIHPDQWTSILIDLAYYKSGDMNQKSLLILHKLFTLKETAFLDAYGTFISCTLESKQLQEKMCEYVPALKLISKKSLDKTQLNEIVRMLNEIISACCIDSVKEILNPVSQRIITGYGILDLSIGLIRHIKKSKSSATILARGSVVVIIDLLRHLAVSNSSFQEDLFDQLDNLLDIFDDPTIKSHSGSLTECSKEMESKFLSSPFLPTFELARLLREGLFLNNRGFCVRIKAHQLNRLINLVASIARHNPLDGAEFIHMLQSLAVCDYGRAPLKRNQLLIMKYLMKNFSQVVYILDSKAIPRIDLLTKKPRSNDAVYFNRIVDLFVICCQGENQYVQSLCRTIIPMDELLKLLASNKIHVTFKRGLLQYFCKVYLSRTAVLNQEGDVRTFLESEICENLLKYLDETSQKTEELLQKAGNMNIMGLLKRDFITKPPTEIQVADNVQIHIQNTIYGSAVFMANFCTCCHYLKYKLPDYLTDVVASINKRILNQFSVLFRYQLHPSVFDEITESMIQIIAFSKATPEAAIALASVHCKPKIFDEDPKKELDKQFSEEIDLNLRLQTFLFNCSQVQSGRNRIKDQLNINIDKEYLNPSDQTALPLSKDFQNHIRAFLISGQAKGDSKRYKNIEVLLRQLETSGQACREGKPTSINKIDQDDLDLRCLQIIRCLIYNEQVLLPRDWESRIIESSIQDALKSVRQVQNCLNKLEVSNRTQVHMINSCDSVRKEVVILQSAMLINGNVKVQMSMLKYFQTATNEVFFGAIRQQLEEAFVDLKDQKLMNVGKKALMDIDAIDSSNGELNLKEFSHVLQQQLRDYESNYYDDHRSLALNESFMLRKLRQLLTPNKSENESSWGILSCCSRKSTKGKYEMKQPANEVLVDNEKSENQYSADDDIEMDVIVVGKPMPINDDNVDSNAADGTKAVISRKTIPDAMEPASLARGDPQQQVKLVLQLLSRMCVGQFFGLQNYLRCQQDNYASVDVVSLVVHFLGSIYANLNDKNIDLSVLAFETIKEAILGNKENRYVVYRAKVVDYSNFILRNSDMWDNLDFTKMLQLFSSISRVIMALIEENGPEQTDLANEIKVTLDINAIYHVMTYCHEVLEKQKLKWMKEKVYDVGFSYFLILARFEDLDNGRTLRAAHPTERQVQAFRYFRKGEGSIEILKDGELQRIHFRLRNKELLRDSVKEKVKWEVDRTTASNKIQSFMNWSKLIIPDMSFQRKIISNPVLTFLTKQWVILNYLMTFISLVICIILLVGIKAPDGGFLGLEKTPSVRSSAFDGSTTISWKSEFEVLKTVVKVLGIIHSVICALVLLIYLITDRPTIRTLIGYFTTLKDNVVKLVVNKDYDDENFEKETTNVSLFSLVTFIYYAICLALSIYGYQLPYVYAFHLLGIIHHNQLLKGVIASVTTNGRVLIWVMILMIIVMYLFTIFAFCLLRPMFDPEAYLYTKTLVQTFVTIIRFGIVGDLFENTVPNEADKKTITQATGKFSQMLAFQLTFFIVITIMGLNIVFGIIIDSFSELRDLKFRAEKDMKEMCFICSKLGYEFDHSRTSFAAHVAREHNMWDYLFYFLHLKEKNISDYYQLDLYIANMLKKENYDFFPINHALALKSDEKEDSISDNIYGTINKFMDYHQKALKEKLHKIELKRQQEQRLRNSQDRNDEETSSSEVDNPKFMLEEPLKGETESDTTSKSPKSPKINISKISKPFDSFNQWFRTTDSEEKPETSIKK